MSLVPALRSLADPSRERARRMVMGEGFVGSFRILDEPMGRRTWPDEEKLRIVMESYVPGMWRGSIGSCRRNSRPGADGSGGAVRPSGGGAGEPGTAEFVPLMVEVEPSRPTTASIRMGEFHAAHIGAGSPCAAPEHLPNGCPTLVSDLARRSQVLSPKSNFRRQKLRMGSGDPGIEWISDIEQSRHRRQAAQGDAARSGDLLACNEAAQNSIHAPNNA